MQHHDIDMKVILKLTHVSRKNLSYGIKNVTAVFLFTTMCKNIHSLSLTNYGF